MTDLNKEREAFEALQNPLIFERIVYINTANLYTVKNDFQNDMFTLSKCNELNFGWSMWQKAKAQAVPNQTINEIQSWIAVQSTQAMELDGEEFVVGANELAEFIEQLVKSESGAEG